MTTNAYNVLDTSTELQIAPARTTWAAAGGSAPSIVATDPFGSFTEADPTFGTGSTRDSSWNEIGKEAFGHFRLIFGSGMTAGTGFYVITGWPKLPVITGGNARFLGDGVVVDASDSSYTLPAQLLIDPNVDATRPFVVTPAYWNAGVFTKGSIPIVRHDYPIAFAAGDIINISFRFEVV